MTREELVQQVSAQLARPLDATCIKALETAWDILSREPPGRSGEDVLAVFQGLNIQASDYEAMSETAKAGLMSELEATNQDWLRQQFAHLKADWLTIIDGQIIRHGPMKHYPSDEELEILSEQYGGKYPYVFEDPLLSLGHCLGPREMVHPGSPG